MQLVEVVAVILVDLLLDQVAALWLIQCFLLLVVLDPRVELQHLQVQPTLVQVAEVLALVLPQMVHLVLVALGQ
jgi:hypothetical protein